MISTENWNQSDVFYLLDHIFAPSDLHHCGAALDDKRMIMSVTLAKDISFKKIKNYKKYITFEAKFDE